MRRRSLLILALLLTLASVLAAGCGGNDDDPAKTAKLLSQTFGGGERVKSGKLDLVVDVNAGGLSGLPSPLRISVNGPFQGMGAGKDPKFDFDLGLKTQDGQVQIGAISTGRKSWMKLAEHAYTLRDGAFADFGGGSGKNDASGGLSTFGVDPRPWMEDPHIVGDEKLDGEAVTHVRAGVDVSGLIGDLGGIFGRAGSAAGAGGAAADVSQEQKDAIAKAVKSASVDIWTGKDDHKLRRISVLVNTETEAQKDGHIRLDLAVTQQDREQPIGPPANPRPLSALTAALAELGARTSKGASSGSGSTGTQTTPLPQGASAYDRCIAGAGDDIEAAQRCASLVGQ